MEFLNKVTKDKDCQFIQKFKDTHGCKAENRDYELISDVQKTVKHIIVALSDTQSPNTKRYKTLLRVLKKKKISEYCLKQHRYLFDPVDLDQPLLNKFMSVMLEPKINTEVVNSLVDVNEKLNSNTLKANLLKWTKSYELEILGEQRVIALQFVHAVAMYGRFHLIKPLYRCNVNFDASTEEGFTPLMLASRFGHVEVVRKLCNVVRSLDAVCEAGFTALHFAVCYNHSEVVKVLFNNGADFTVSTGGYVGSPIVFAILLEHFEMFDLLWNNFCERFKQPTETKYDSHLFETVYGKILQAAVTVGNDKVLKELQKQYHRLCGKQFCNICPNILDTTDDDGNTLTMIASAKGDISIVNSLILLEANVDLKNIDGDTALHIAASKGHTEVVKLLLENPHRLGVRNKEGQTPLHAALRGHENQLDIAQVIINFAVDNAQESILTMQDMTGVAAIHLVVASGLTELARVLLERDPNSWKLKTESNDTALHIAALHGFKDIVELIIQDADDDDVLRFLRWKNGDMVTLFNGFEVDGDTHTDDQDAVDSKCITATPLHAAAMCYKPPFHDDTYETIEKKKAEVMKLLLRNVPTKHIIHLHRQKLMQDKNGCNPLHLAVKNEHDYIFNAIIDFVDRSSDVFRDRIIPALMGCEDTEGRTPLYVAASNGRVESTTRLMKLYPGSLLISDQEKKTPLHISAVRGFSSVVGAILDFIKERPLVDPATRKMVNCQEFCELTDDDGNNALHCAVLSGKIEVVKLLLECCPSLRLKRNDQRETPLFMAASKGHEEATKVLLHVDCSNLQRTIDLLYCRSYQCEQEWNELKRVKSSTREMTTKAVVRPRSNSYSGVTNPTKTTYIGRWSALHAAARNGHSQVVKVICDFLTTFYGTIQKCRLAHKMTDMLDKSGKSPVHLAFERGHIATIEVFISDPGILKLEMMYLQTPLHLAVKHSQKRVVQYIIDFVNERKNDVRFKNLANIFHLRDANGYTLMHSAAKLKSSEIFKMLLTFPKNITTCGTVKKWTPLHVAANRGNIEVVRAIINYFKSNTNDLVRIPGITMDEIAMMLSTKKETALYLAASNGHTEIVDLLIPYSSESLTQESKNPLHVAAKNGHVEVFRTLMNSLESFDTLKFVTDIALVQDQDGNNPLHLAASEGHVEVAQVFLENSKVANTVKNTKEEWTALHVAARNGHASVVRAIVNSLGSNQFDRVDKFGRTPLRLAADHGSVDCIKELTCCCKLDKTCVDGRTALMICAERGDAGGVEWLIEHGADGTIKDRSGETALYKAIQNGEIECIRQLKSVSYDTQSEGSTRSALHCAARSKQKDVLQTFLQTFSGSWNKKSLNVWDNSRKTALVICTERGDAAAINTLIKFGADSNATDSCGETALHIAVKQGYIDCIKALEKVNYDISSESEGNSTALHYAARSDQPGVLKTFLATFPQINGRLESLNKLDKHGYTALMICAEKGDVDGVKLLTKYKAILEPSMNRSVLHELVNKYVENPKKVHLLEVIKIVNNDELNHEPIPCRIESRNFNLDLTPIELSAALGSTDILKIFLHRNIERLDNKVLFYMNDIVPSTLINNNHEITSPRDGSGISNVETFSMEDINSRISSYGIKSSSCKTLNDYSRYSCTEMIVRYCRDEEILDMMNIEPLRVFLEKFSLLRSLVFIFLLVHQILYMSFYTSFVLGTTAGDPPPASNNTVRFWTRPAIEHDAIVLIVWSLLILLLNFLYFLTLFDHFKTTLRICKRRCSIDFILGFFSTGMSSEASVSSYIHYFGVSSAIVRFAIPILAIASLVHSMFLTRESYSAYVSVTTTVLVIGWVQTIGHTKGFSGIYAFYFTLKLVLVRDLLRIAVVYLFILVGFSCAAQVFIVTDSPWNDRNYTLWNSLYELYGTMLGRGDLFALASEDDYQFTEISAHGIRLFISIYCFVSTILILNISIAATGNAFSQVSELKKALWCMETIYFVDWISHDNCCTSWLRAIFRFLLNKFIFKHDSAKGPYIKIKIT